MALDCSKPIKPKPQDLPYHSELETVARDAIPEHHFTYQYHPPKGKHQFDMRITNLNHNTWVDYASAARGHKARFRVTRKQGQKRRKSVLHIRKTKTRFTQHSFHADSHSKQIAGISTDGKVIAMTLSQHLALDYVYSTLETIIFRGQTQHRLPLKQGINSFGGASSALLSSDGNRLLLLHGLTVELYEYQSDRQNYAVVGQQDLTELLPEGGYNSRSFRISSDGLQAFLLTPTDQAYRVRFVPD